MLTMDDKKIKESLKNYHKWDKQIHTRIIQIEQTLNETSEELIRISSLPKIDYEYQIKGGGTRKDLSDAYLRYNKLVEEKEKDLTKEICYLTDLLEDLNRLYLCFQALSLDEYDLIYHLYVLKEPYKAVELDSGLNHRIFEDRRRNALLNIKKMYESDVPNSHLIEQKHLWRRKAPMKQSVYHQISLFDDDQENLKCQIPDVPKFGTRKG